MNVQKLDSLLVWVKVLHMQYHTVSQSAKKMLNTRRTRQHNTVQHIAVHCQTIEHKYKRKRDDAAVQFRNTLQLWHNVTKQHLSILFNTYQHLSILSIPINYKSIIYGKSSAVPDRTCRNPLRWLRFACRVFLLLVLASVQCKVDFQLWVILGWSKASLRASRKMLPHLHQLFHGFPSVLLECLRGQTCEQ